MSRPAPARSQQEDARMSMLSNLDLIRRVPLFSMLTADQAQSIADSVSKRRFRRGERQWRREIERQRSPEAERQRPRHARTAAPVGGGRSR